MAAKKVEDAGDCEFDDEGWSWERAKCRSVSCILLPLPLPPSPSPGVGDKTEKAAKGLANSSFGREVGSLATGAATWTAHAASDAAQWSEDAASKAGHVLGEAGEAIGHYAGDGATWVGNETKNGYDALAATGVGRWVGHAATSMWVWA